MAKKCGAHARSTGKPCIQDVAVDGTRCRFHGGAAPQVKAAAARTRAKRVAAEAVRTYGLPVEIDHTEALIQEVHWTAGHVAWLRERVQEVEQEALIWGVTKRENKTATEFSGMDETEQAVPNVWLELYRAERKHLLDVCKTCAAIGIEERRVRLAEEHGSMLAGAIQRILGELNLSVNQQRLVTDVVPRVLRGLAGPVAA